MCLMIVPTQTVVLLTADGGAPFVVHRARWYQRVCRSRGAVQQRARARLRAALRPLRTPLSQPFRRSKSGLPAGQFSHCTIPFKFTQLFFYKQQSCTESPQSLEALHEHDSRRCRYLCRGCNRSEDGAYVCRERLTSAD